MDELKRLKNKFGTIFFICIALTPSVFWCVAAWPGYMNSDAYLVFEEARKSSFSNWHPVLFGWIMKLGISFNGSPAPVLLLQTLFIVSSSIYFVHSLRIKTHLKFTLVFLYFLLPTNGVFFATLGKDVFFMGSLLLLAGGLLRIYENQLGLKDLSLATIGIFGVSSFRWNGPVVALLAIVLICVIVKRLNRTVIVLGLGFICGTMFLFSPPLSDNHGARSIREVGQQLDLAWLLRAQPSVFSKEELATLNYIAPVNKWADSQANCDNSVMPLIWGVFTVDSEAGSRLKKNSRVVSEIWNRHVRQNTLEIFKGRSCRSRAILGLTSIYPPMKAESSSEVLAQWYSTSANPLNDRIHLQGLDFANWWRFLPYISILGQPMIPTILLVLRLIIGKARKETVLPLLLGIGGVLSVAIAGTGIEPRYLHPYVFLMWLSVVAPLQLRENIYKSKRSDTVNFV